jgi:putative ABC transport system permease protein
MKFWRQRKDEELDAEIRSHLDEAIHDRIERGESPDEARVNALREFGNVILIKEVTRAMWGWSSLDRLGQDLRFGLRMLVKNPSFTAVVVLTLALGIGANAALFSVVNGVLLNPLPYSQPDQLVALHQRSPNFETGSIPYPNFRDWQKDNQTFSAMALARPFSFSLLGEGEAEQVRAQLVSADFFSLLGVKPKLGRSFAPGEDERGAAPVVLISARLWQRKFGSAPDALGKSLTLDDKSYTIAGVLPAEFTFSFRNVSDADVYVPIGQWNVPQLQNRNAGLAFFGIGRLKAGVTIAQAQADLDRVTQNLAAAYPATNRGIGAKIIPLKERIVGNVRPVLLMLLGAVGFVLLIACVNVSNLLLARSTARTREFAIRAALGAGRWRLLRQSLTESTLLAFLGGGLGLAVAALGTNSALAALPTAVPRAQEVGLDGRVLFFTCAVTLLTGVLAGMAPALKTAQGRLAEMLKEGGRGISGRQRAQSVLVAVEMALALLLLTGAGLMIRSLSALWSVDTGFRADNMLTFSLSLAPSMKTASPEAIRNAFRELRDELNAVPGVQAASFSFGANPLQYDEESFFWREGQPKPANRSEMNATLVYRGDPSYLNVLGIPLKQGRFFTEQDDEQAQQVVVIDEVFARQYFPNENPVGQRLYLDGGLVQIVGVVGHIKQWSLDADDKVKLQAQLYEPFMQLSDNAMRTASTSANVVVRFAGGDAALPSLLDSIRHAAQSQHRENVIIRPQTMNEIIAGSLAPRRFLMILLEAFAVSALVLASVGLYGVISYLVGQRTHELGIRLALGAQRRAVLWLVINHGMKMALGGVALGLFAALSLTRLLAKLLYGVSATDPLTFAVIALLLAAVALLACFAPAWRATKVDPLVAFRHE